MSTGLLESHKRYLEYYIHEHSLSWRFIGVGWAANVGLFSAIGTILSLESPLFFLAMLFCAVGIISNAALWLALNRNDVYKNSIAYEGEKIEELLEKYYGINVRTFRTRKKIREGWHPIGRRRLYLRENLASTQMHRYAFFVLIIVWGVLASSLPIILHLFFR